MKTSEIVHWVEHWFDPNLDLDRAAAEWGRVVPGDSASMPAVEPRDARFSRVNLELLGEPAGFLSGVVAHLAAPEPLRWDQVKARYGEPRFVGLGWDQWNGPRQHTFKLEQAGMRGYLLLGVHGHDEPVVQVDHMAIRRFPPGGL